MKIGNIFHRYRSTWLTLFCCFIMFFVQNIPVIIGKIVNYQDTISKVAPFKWNIDTSNLELGHYFITLGRPRAQCNIKHEHYYLHRGVIDSSKRQFLTSSSHIFIGKHNDKVLIQIDCSKKEKGFSNLIFLGPIIAKYNQGQLLQILDIFLEIVLGPTIALFFLIISIFGYFKNIIKKEILLFGIISLAYSSSLAYITRLFFDGQDSTYIHIVLRSLYSVSIYMAFGYNSPKRNSVTLLNLSNLIGLIFVGYFHNNILINMYKVTYFIYPLTLGILSYDIYKANSENYKNSILVFFLNVLLISQTFDWTVLMVGIGIYTAPVAATFASIAVIWVIFNEFKIDNIVKNLNSRIFQIIEDSSSGTEALKAVSNLIQQYTGFDRLSCYLDNSLQGYSNNKMEIFSRIHENGYLKDTTKDKSIIFNDNRGTLMKKALQSGRPIKGIGEQDQSFYVVTPIGQFACLNFSNKKIKSNLNNFENYEIIKRTGEALTALKNKLQLESNLNLNTIEKLRSSYKPGTYTKNIGAIFIDIDNYSKFLEVYGNNFSEFISSDYLPSLARYLHSFAIPESIKSDEILFYVIDQSENLNDINVNATDSTFIALNRLLDFINNPGAQMCQNSGYPNISFHIGVATGSGELIIDEFTVRIAGTAQTKAFRLLKSTSKQQIFLEYSDDLESKLGKHSITILRKGSVLEKKNIINYVEIKKSKAA